MIANMTRQEELYYDKAFMCVGDARGSVELAREEGEKIGIEKNCKEYAAKRHGYSAELPVDRAVRGGSGKSADLTQIYNAVKLRNFRSAKMK